MKKINLKLILIFTLFVNFISCRAQTLPLNTLMENIPSNAYVKDLNDEFTPYVGTYKSNFQNNEITLYISKQINRLMKLSNKQFYQDALVIKYIVKNSSGTTLQDIKNYNIPTIEIYSTGTDPSKNKINFFYTGTHCNVGWGGVYLSKINSEQISWSYRPNSTTTENCPAGTDIKIYLPDTDNLIFTKQ